MSTRALRASTDLVKLHADVEGGALTEAVFAIDLHAIAAADPSVPVVNQDPEAFFRATYLTADLQKLLEEVLASLAGKPGYNRVLKTAAEQAALKKLLANWRALIDQRLAASDMPLFSRKEAEL